jgi:hypothetical protein
VKQALTRANAQGQPEAMGLDDFTELVRNDPSWAKQAGTVDKTMAVGKQVLKDMGLTS